MKFLFYFSSVLLGAFPAAFGGEDKCDHSCPPGYECRIGWGTEGPNYQCFEKRKSKKANIFFNNDLSGKYLMKIKIGDRLFEDILELQSENGPISLMSFNGKIEGTLTVPNVFSSPLAGQGYCHSWGSCHFEFEITAKENGSEFKVFYQANLNPENYQKVISGLPAVLTGKATLENGDLLGNFDAIRQ